jgi:cytochrome c553
MSFRHLVAAVALLSGSAAFAQDAAPAASASASAPAPAASAAAIPGDAIAEFAATHPGDAKAGQAKAAVCGACHGMDGNSTDPQYPRLAGQNEQYIAEQLGLFKYGVRQNPIMLGFASALGAQDMRDIGAYFATQKPLPGVADAKLVQQSEAIYRGGDAARQVPACMACHGPDGGGNPGAGYPRLAGQHADYVQTMLKSFRSESLGNAQPAKNAPAKTLIMPAIAGRLTEADIAALASYVEGLHTAEAGGGK